MSRYFCQRCAEDVTHRGGELRCACTTSPSPWVKYEPGIGVAFIGLSGLVVVIFVLAIFS